MSRVAAETPAIATPAWIARFDEAVSGLDTGDLELSILHRIEGDGAWLVTASGGHARVLAAEPDAAADLTFTWQRDDAEAVARGEVGPLVAFQAGRLRVGGDLTRLGEAAELVGRFPPPGGAPGDA